MAEQGWGNMLRAKPRHNLAAKVGEQSSEGLTVWVKQQRPSFLVPPISWVVPFKEEKKVVFDQIGTQIWRQCDGRHTVEDIIDHFAQTYRLSFHEARVAVTQYLGSLVQRGTIAMEVEKA